MSDFYEEEFSEEEEHYCAWCDNDLGSNFSIAPHQDNEPVTEIELICEECWEYDRELHFDMYGEDIGELNNEM